MKKLLSLLILFCFLTGLSAQRPQNISVAAVNSKEAYPIGVGEAHVIEAGTDITYTIYFQNNGTDTAYNVRILDTLSNHLDISTIRKEGSSHMSELTILEGNILKVSFANIRLPNVSINDDTSRGFVSFSIESKENLPDGTLILNDAAIGFDFAPPIITNTVYHTIGNNVINGITDLSVEDLISIYPNPVKEKVTIEMGKVDFSSGHLLVFDTGGRLIMQQSFTSPKIELERGDIVAGQYFYKLFLDDNPAKSGKLILQ